MFYERDIRQIKSGEKTELIYTTVTGIKPDLSGPQQIPEILDNSAETIPDASSDEGSSEDSSEDENDKKTFVNSARPRDESPNSRKVFFFIGIFYFSFTL